MEILYDFLCKVSEDARISAAHISLYVALWKLWMEKGFEHPLSFFRSDVIAVGKISGTNTYYRIIRQLHEYGYIKYVPSYNHFLGSLVWFGEVSGQ